MHGLINKAIQNFVSHTYGAARWQVVTRSAGLDFHEFEAMLVYDDGMTRDILDALRRELGRDLEDILEDLGTHLVSNPEETRLRRLLRFSGVTYADFLHSLDDLPDRVRLAISDLNLPNLELREHATGEFTLTVGEGIPGFASVIMGVLRAMADDYGALALLDYRGSNGGNHVISIRLVELSFAEGKEFELGAPEQ
ncbi:MAG: heme NO-binding domain-containing protein [Paracoccaceae bacterium]